MKVAVAGTGNVAQYLMEELSSYGHDVIVLTRRQKPQVSAIQRETDYSVESLASALSDRVALVSTVSDYENPPNAISTHLNMLEALKQSEKCKTFIPSEWTLNVEDYPEQATSFSGTNKEVHEALKNQTEVKWTIISNSWFADYILPNTQRHLRDIHGLIPMDYQSKTFTIYGPGTQIISMTSARDVAKGVAALLDSNSPWEPYTYISGQQLTWNELFATIKSRDASWKRSRKPLAHTIQQLIDKTSPEFVMEAEFEIHSYAGALQLPQEKLQRQKEKYFPNIYFRNVNEILDAAAAQPDAII